MNILFSDKSVAVAGIFASATESYSQIADLVAIAGVTPEATVDSPTGIFFLAVPVVFHVGAIVAVLYREQFSFPFHENLSSSIARY